MVRFIQAAKEFEQLEEIRLGLRKELRRKSNFFTIYNAWALKSHRCEGNERIRFQYRAFK